MPGIKLTQKAEQDLTGIYQYGFREFGEQQADRYSQQLEKALALLAENPLICRERTEFTPPVRIHPVMKHQIIYSYQPDYILLIRVLHKSMEVKNHLSPI